MKYLVPILFATATILPTVTVSGAEKLSYNRDVRPILSDACFRCHGPDEKHLKAKLRLDNREAALKKEAFVPGKPAESEFVKRMRTEDTDDIMPPPESVRQLTAAEKDILERWIAEGAVYEPHWAYVQPIKSPIPTSKNPAWNKNPIDAFIHARLDKEGLTPSVEADRRTLIRRVTLDLIGVPPTPDEVNAFLADQSPMAYERVIDRLLASPRYGERMAVPWLDAVRFADTVGFHGDQNQNNFPYRDWVINAFNRNIPFDRFTAEQLAGDLLPDATTESRVASGFNRLNMMTREGGAQPKEYLAKYAADRVRTLGGAFLGSTLGCAECHSHKYDPWSIEDFYQFSSFFADIKQWGVYADYKYTKNTDLKGYGNDHPFPPEIEVESPYLLKRIATLTANSEKIAQAAFAKHDAQHFSAWQKSLRDFQQTHPAGWAPLSVSKASGKRKGKTEKDTYKLDADGTAIITAARDSDVHLIVTTAPGWIASLRLQLAPVVNNSALLDDTKTDNKHEEEDQEDKENSKKLPVINVALLHTPKGSEKPTAINFRLGDASDKRKRYNQGHEILGLDGGWFITHKIAQTNASATFVLDHPIQLQDGDTLTLVLKKNVLSAARFFASPFIPNNLASGDISAAQWQAAFSKPANSFPGALSYLLGTQFDRAAFSQVAAAAKEIAESRDGKVMTTVSEAMEPATTRVLARGNWLDESGAIVTPKAPAFLPQIPNPDQRRLNRLDLAQWLTSDTNPLTARVFMNRLWAQFMGVGLSASLDDMGLQGEPPSHPELLDFLAIDFREHKWDMKRAVKQILLSMTYRQVAVQRPEIVAKDPANRLRAMQSVRRLDAEFIRDNALAISGLIVHDIGGPSIKPYQPSDYYANLQFPSRDYLAHTNDQQYRRGIYMHWQRTFLHPMLANFDAPSREECTIMRPAANSPQQALTLLNDPTFVEAARVFAASLHQIPGDDKARLISAFERTIARQPSPEELTRLLALLAQQKAHYTAHLDQAAALLRIGLAPLPPSEQHATMAAWTHVCRVLLNLHETISRL
jgi:Protein of unknown function (DUF1553)/Protein of unknown function (DUF1549)/Planctomycete cytochrome C